MRIFPLPVSRPAPLNAFRGSVLDVRLRSAALSVLRFGSVFPSRPLCVSHAVPPDGPVRRIPMPCLSTFGFFSPRLPTRRAGRFVFPLAAPFCPARVSFPFPSVFPSGLPIAVSIDHCHVLSLLFLSDFIGALHDQLVRDDFVVQVLLVVDGVPRGLLGM